MTVLLRQKIKGQIDGISTRRVPETIKPAYQILFHFLSIVAADGP